MKKAMACSCLVALCAAFWSPGVGAQGPADSKVVASEAQRLELGVGNSKVVDLTTSIKRASLANPEVADTVVLSPKQIYLTGKAIGVTTLTLWKESGELFSVFDITVTPYLSQLREQVHKMLPGEKDIAVTATHDHVTLSGTISNLARQSRALEIAEPYAPKRVVNLLQVGGAQQVMLEVRFAEMNRDLNPTDPTIIGSANMSGDAQGVSISENYAYVASGESGLQIIDVSHATNLTIVGSVDTPDWAHDVHASGNHAYVADFDSGLQVIDVSNPANPTLVGSVQTLGYPTIVHVSGNYA